MTNPKPPEGRAPRELPDSHSTHGAPPAPLSRRDFIGMTGCAAAGIMLAAPEPVCYQPEAAGERPISSPALAGPGFARAQPVWPRERQSDMNLLVGFRAAFSQAELSEPVELLVAGGSLYRIFLNGAFVGHGPARGPHGHLRLDRWRLPEEHLQDENLLAVEVAGYNINSFYLINQKPYLQAEIVSNGEVLAATGVEDATFEAAILSERIQKVQRYSFQRTFVEAYRLTPDGSDWRHNSESSFEPVPLVADQPFPLLQRRVPYPEFYRRGARRLVARGHVEKIDSETPWRDRALTDIGPELLGYKEDELELVLSEELDNLSSTVLADLRQDLGPDDSVPLLDKEFAIVDIGTNLTGFVGLTVNAKTSAKVYLVFDEILTAGDVDYKRLSCVNAISLQLEAGEHLFESFEPYTFRYLKVICLEGVISFSSASVREYVFPDIDEAHFAAADPRLNRLFEAGRETYRQNAVDVFMDCPSRERAGWLCDSFFTARTADRLSRSHTVESNLFENYLLPENFKFLPSGMLPMCYPADHYNGQFIPNWSLWFVLQLEEYLQRSGDQAMVSALERRIEDLFGYFEQFHNEDGLLEKLESWVFVEWSEANNLVQDVNYPSNMLYAAALEAAGRLYDRAAWHESAEGIRSVVRGQSFDGQFFVDNALRVNGRLEVTQNRTEVCQYFAFYFGAASPETHPELWQTLKTYFGPHRDASSQFPEIHPANAFVGNVMRLELLSRAGLGEQILDESVAYLLFMADRTGTLWEHDNPEASCNHGFASHVVHTLYRDVLGCYAVSDAEKRVSLRFVDVDLPWCEGIIPCRDGFVRLRWEKNADVLHYFVDVPAGYAIEVENLSGMVVAPRTTS